MPGQADQEEGGRLVKRPGDKNWLADNNPNANNSKSNGMVASNGAISGGNNSQIKGGVMVGPGGSINFSYTGAKTVVDLFG